MHLVSPISFFKSAQVSRTYFYFCCTIHTEHLEYTISLIACCTLAAKYGFCTYFSISVIDSFAKANAQWEQALNLACFLLDRCCEKTLDVLRQNQEAVLTILQVLLYDPLYAWTMSAQKALQLQHRRTEPGDTELNTTTGGGGGGDLLDYAGQRPASKSHY